MVQFSQLILFALFIFAASPASAMFSLAFRGLGLHSSAPSSGLVAAIKPSGSWDLALSYNMASLDDKKAITASKNITDKQTDINITKATIKRDFIEAQLRFYPRMGTFFWSLGAISGKTKGTFLANSTIDSQTMTRDYEYDSTFATVSIGNIWKFGVFIIGAEWIGFSTNLSNKLTTTTTGPSSATGTLGDAEKEFSDLMKFYGCWGGITALLVHVGVDF